MNWITWPHNARVRPAHADGRGTGSWLASAQEILIFGFERLGDWQERTVQRRRLMTMDPRMLHDIGLCREDAINEAMKPFWRA